MKLDITKTNIKYNNYSGLPFEIQFLKDIKEGHSCLRILNTLYASSKVKNENNAIQNRISDFDKRRISKPKTQRNKPAMDNRRLLIVAVFQFVHPVEKDS